MDAYYVYILASRSRNLYIGVTSELTTRIAQHKAGQIPGFTQTYRIDRLVNVEQFSSRNEAIAREKQLKGWRRARKVELIEATNPAWDDLAEEI